MIKSIISFAIEKSRLNHILFIFLILLGSYAYKNLPKEIFPPTNLDAISITGAYGGSSPTILDKLAVTPIEDELKNLSDISKVESVVKNGFFSITAYLKDDSNPDDALSDIKDSIAKIKIDLPSDMNEPTAKKVVNSFPLITIAIFAQEDKLKLIEVAKKLKRELSSIDNLSTISIRGDSDQELVFSLNSQKISALGLNLSTVINALSSLSNIFPVGFIEQKGEHVYLNTQSGFKDIQRVKNTILKIKNKKVILSSIADVEFSLSDSIEISHFNGIPNLSVNINKSKQGNAITLAKDIKKIVKKYNKLYPSYNFETYSDSSVWIRNRLNTVISNILFGLILVSLSVYIFINARISFVVAIGIPTSFLIGLMALNYFGYSLNMLSLLGALIALGMLVDEAIVVAENIQRHIEEGDDPKTAAINGATEMFPAVLTATATTIFAFLPLLIMSGEMGVFMKILPIMITILLLSSLFEAFIFLPLHSCEILKKDVKSKKSDKLWIVLKDFYRFLLTHILKTPKRSLGVFVVVVFSLTALLLSSSKFQLFPDFDTTQIFIKGAVNKNNSLEETQLLVTKIEKVLLTKLKKSEVSSLTSISGLQIDNKFKAQVSQNYFQIFVNLHERKPTGLYNRFVNPIFSPEYDDGDMIREKSARELAKIIKTLTKKFQQDSRYEEFEIVVPGAGIVKSDIEISLIGENSNIKQALTTLENKLKSINGTLNISHDMKEGESEIKFSITPYGESLGFSERTLSNILRPLFLKSQISNMYLDKKLIKIKTQDINKDNISSLNTLMIDIPNTNQKILLHDIVEFEKLPAFSTTYKEDGFTIWTITGSLDKTKLTSSELMTKIKPTLDSFKTNSIIVKVKGEEQESNKVKSEMMQAAVIAIFLIFIALVWMFDSYKLSLLVLSTIPLSIFGVLIGHILMGLNLTMPGLLGVVGLTGVIVNDGIIMIDFLKRATEFEEVLKLAEKRLRPILLTSITTILGLSTLIFFAEGQSVILQPMAVSLGFGLMWATVVNLLFLPLFFYTVNMKKLKGNG